MSPGLKAFAGAAASAGAGAAVRRRRGGSQSSVHGHHEPRCAESTLRRVQPRDTLLNRMRICSVPQTLNGRDRRTITEQQREDTGVHGKR